MALLFAAEARPSAAEVAALLADGDASMPITLADQGSSADGSLEVVAQGLAFEVIGLREDDSLPVPPIRHWIGLDPQSPQGLAAVTVQTGLHLRAAANLLPVVRVQAAIAARLAAAAGARAACWPPAASAMAPKAFVSAVSTWLGGGPFPVLGLTALVAEPDGALRSEGLAFFTGQELRIEPDPARSPRDSARIGVRLIDELVGAEPLSARTRFTGPSGESLVAEPDGEHGVIRIYSEA